MIRKVLGAVASLVVGTLFMLPTPASATEVAPVPVPSASVGGEVRYILGYQDNCDGSIEVAILNGSDESATFKINGEEISIEPMGLAHLKIPRPEKGVADVKVTVKLGKWKIDRAKHTWVKPTVCVHGSPSASASSAPPSTPPTSAMPTPTGSDVGAGPGKLALTGFDAGKASGLGLAVVAAGGALCFVGRRRYVRRHAVR